MNYKNILTLFSFFRFFVFFIFLDKYIIYKIEIKRCMYVNVV